MTEKNEKTEDPANPFSDWVMSHRDMQCDLHGPYRAAVIVLHGGHERIAPCPACMEEELQAAASRDRAQGERLRMEAREAAQRDRAERMGATIPTRFIASTIDGFDVSGVPQKELIRKTALRYVDTWADRLREGHNLMMVGGTGAGKTHIACAIAIQLAARYRCSVVFGTLATLSRSLKATFGPSAPGLGEQEVMNGMIAPDMLIIDDVGSRSASEFDRSLLFDIIDSRYGRRRPVIITSNLSRDELAEYLGSRISDRLIDPGTMMIFNWPSYRGRTASTHDRGTTK